MQVPTANRIPTSFTTTHNTDGLPGWGALDWFKDAGTIVGAPASGTIERVGGSAGSRGTGIYGRNVYLKTDSGQRLFLTHFSDLFVRGSQRVEAGEPLGRVAPYGNASHIHVAVQGAADKGGKVDIAGKGEDDGGIDFLPDWVPGKGKVEAVASTTDTVLNGPADLVRWIGGNWNRIAQVGGGFVLLLVGLLLLGRRLGAELPGPAALR